MFKEAIIRKFVRCILNESFFHQTSIEKVDNIKKNGFNTPEVWVAPDDTAFYGEAVIEIEAPKSIKPFVMDKYAAMDYGITNDEIEKNITFYNNLGGEANPKTFNKLRELGYDVVIEVNGDRGYLYPKTLKVVDSY